MADNQIAPPEPPQRPNTEQNQGSQPNPNDPQQLQPNMLDLQALKTARTLTVIACIAGPISLFIGGVLLSTVGLVCGFIGYRKLKALCDKKNNIVAFAKRLKRSSTIGIIVCVVALILNAVSLYIMFPTVMGMLETGDYSGIAADAGGGAIGPNSTWG